MRKHPAVVKFVDSLILHDICGTEGGETHKYIKTHVFGLLHFHKPWTHANLYVYHSIYSLIHDLDEPVSHFTPILSPFELDIVNLSSAQSET